MIKLKDILDTAKAHVSIMENTFPVIQIDTKFDASEKFSKNFLERGVRQIDTYNDRIRVWLVEEEENV